MKTYILILLFTGYYKGGITTAEFNTKETCETAGNTAVETFENYIRDIKYICVPK